MLCFHLLCVRLRASACVRFSRHSHSHSLHAASRSLSRSFSRSLTHCHARSDLFSKHQRSMVLTSDACLLVMYSALAAATWLAGAAAVGRLYFAPWLVFVVWLDTVTYLHHHGLPEEATDKMPWYRCAWGEWVRKGSSVCVSERAQASAQEGDAAGRACTAAWRPSASDAHASVRRSPPAPPPPLPTAPQPCVHAATRTGVLSGATCVAA